MKKHIKAKNIIIIRGTMLSLAIDINFYIFFFSAAVSGSWSVTIFFNQYIEGILQVVMYLFILPLIVISAILILIDIVKSARFSKK
jgi:hypothetical protein